MVLESCFQGGARAYRNPVAAFLLRLYDIMNATRLWHVECKVENMNIKAAMVASAIGLVPFFPPPIQLIIVNVL